MLHAPQGAMSLLSWNCRGLAVVPTINELRELCRSHQPAVVFLMETKAPKERVERIRRTLKFKDMFVVEARGLSGGLCLLWNTKVGLEVLQASPNFIHTRVIDKGTDKMFNCTFVYGNPRFEQRRWLWASIQSLQVCKDWSWCCIGDFNEMINIGEK